MRISDWSSDVCSSDLHGPEGRGQKADGRRGRSRHAGLSGGGPVPRASAARGGRHRLSRPHQGGGWRRRQGHAPGGRGAGFRDRKSVVWGKSVSVRVALGGRRNHKKKIRKVTAVNGIYQVVE